MSRSGVVPPTSDSRALGEVAGLTLAGVAFAFTVMSALNGTPAGAAEFAAANARRRETTGEALTLSAGLVGAGALTLLFLYGHRSVIPATATALAGLGLYGGYRALLPPAAETTGEAA